MKSVALAFVAGVVFLVSAFRGPEVPLPDFLSSLGLSRESAENYFFQSFWNEYVYHPTGERVRAVALGDRPALVREAVEFGRSYFASETFKARYAAARDEGRPTPPEAPKSGEELIAEMKADLQASITDMKAQADQSPPDIKAMLLESVAMLEAQLVELDSPDHPYRDPAMAVAFAEQAAAEQAAYEAELAKWEATFPEDPSARIAQRLEETLALCADVDFSAELVDGPYGKKLFANTAYEMKPAEWKSCYRAGQPAVEAARTAIQGWLTELR